MPNLTTCISCGNNVSYSARTCPHCGSDDPIGVTCFYCLKRIPKASAVTRGLFASDDDATRFHPECAAALSRDLAPVEPLKCRDCGARLGNLPPPNDIICR